MAMIDKVTHMRRCAIINNSNGAIEYEGVWIEGYYILQSLDGGLYRISEDEITEKFYLDDDYVNENLIVFLDEPHHYWIPREQNDQIEWIKELGKYDYK